MNSIKVICIFIIICLAASCNKRPDYVLSDSEMEDLMTDLILADAYEQTASSRNLPDSIRLTLSDAIMAKHGVDQQTLDSTFSWYSRNLDDYYRIYTRIDKRLAKMNRKVRGSRGEDMNLNDIWQLPKAIQMSPNSLSGAFVFEIPGEAIGKGEKLEWYFRLNNEVKADVALGVDYTNGSTALSRREITGNKNVSLNLIVDTLLMPRRIFGLLRVSRRDMPVWLDSIRLTKTPYDSTAYESFRNSRFMMPPKRRINRIIPPPITEDIPSSSTSSNATTPSTITPHQSSSSPPTFPSGRVPTPPDLSRPGL